MAVKIQPSSCDAKITVLMCNCHGLADFQGSCNIGQLCGSRGIYIIGAGLHQEVHGRRDPLQNHHHSAKSETLAERRGALPVENQGRRFQRW